MTDGMAFEALVQLFTKTGWVDVDRGFFVIDISGHEGKEVSAESMAIIRAAAAEARAREATVVRTRFGRAL